MTDYTELQSVGDGAAVIAELAEQAAGREILEVTPTTKIVVLAQGQHVHEIDIEDKLERPLYKTGRVAFREADSLVEYVGRHSVEATTTLWSDVNAGTVIAVLNDHARADDEQVGAPNWGNHRATLRLEETEDWQRWLKHDGRMLDQASFAEHLEDGADAIREPDAATMLEIAQSFHAKTGVNFRSATRLQDGQVQFQYEETTAAKAGHRGDLQIPTEFILGLIPFEGGAKVYAVTARFRYRLVNGALTLGYKLVRPDKVRKAAFVDITTAIADGTGFPVLAGTPRS